MRVIVTMICLALAGCGAPTALQVASLVIDGASYAATGKGTADHALSALAKADCRLINPLRGHAVCGPAQAGGKGPARQVASRNAAGTDTGGAGAREAAPQEGGLPFRPAVRLVRSPGMILAEVGGLPAGSRLAGEVDGDGALVVRAVRPGAAGADRVPLFRLAGFAENPGAFTGVVTGRRFIAADAILP